MAPPKKHEESPSSTPVPSTEIPVVNDGAQLPDSEWEGMLKVLNWIYEYRTQDGFDPSRLFHRKVNKRVIPEYYDTIKEPIALSTIKHKISTRVYQQFSEFVRDFALIPHNAQVFNRPDSGAFQDALIIKEQLESRLQLLVDEGIISKEVATLPDLGEIPTYDDEPTEDADGEVDEEEESEEEGEEDDDDDADDLDDEGQPRKRRGRPRGSIAVSKREALGDDGDSKRARGRPPKLLTPEESRILAVMKALRKPKNARGQLLIKDFDRLPDKSAMPEYYAEVKYPVAYDTLKRKVKRKKYPTLETFMADVNLMFNNAKEYNTDDSQIFKDAVALQIEAGKLYDAEKAKPDDMFADDEGKIAMPTGILHNGELYKAGDWVHVQNPNDLTKPIPAQIYRTYKNPNGQSMVNVCWYYRPEQTVHRFDKHFFANELLKTGRYKDHPIEAIEGKCFIMFFTRYFKGRPRNLPEGTETYVCKDRYNEERHQFNTIKTWASCLPDEVRDKDYEMDLFDHPRRMTKYPSPIRYLLKDDQKETDELPKVQWGADGAPPKIGAVHRRPRTEKDSPPPEPTPPPQPKTELPTPRPLAQSSVSSQTSSVSQSQPGHHSQPAQAQLQQLPAVRPLSAHIKPQLLTASHPQSYSSHSSETPVAQRPTTMQTNNTPSTPQTHTNAASPAPQSSYNQSTVPPNPNQYAPRPNTSSYKDPPAIEVYTLPDQANLSIPQEIREQYQRDEQGRVLFFTTPPVAVGNTQNPSALGGHSVRYLAAKARRANMIAEKRKELELQKEEDERTAKKARVEAEVQTKNEIESLKRKAVKALEDQLVVSIEGQLGDMELGRLRRAQIAAADRKEKMAEHEKKRGQARKIDLCPKVFLDDWDSRTGV